MYGPLRNQQAIGVFMGSRAKEEIEQTYQQTCINYGHISQQIRFIEQQEYDYKTEVERTIAAFQDAKEKLEIQLVAIEKEWNTLRHEIKQVESEPKASEQL